VGTATSGGGPPVFVANRLGQVGSCTPPSADESIDESEELSESASLDPDDVPELELLDPDVELPPEEPVDDPDELPELEPLDPDVEPPEEPVDDPEDLPDEEPVDDPDELPELEPLDPEDELPPVE